MLCVYCHKGRAGEMSQDKYFHKIVPLLIFLRKLLVFLLPLALSDCSAPLQVNLAVSLHRLRQAVEENLSHHETVALIAFLPNLSTLTVLSARSSFSLLIMLLAISR